MAILIKTVKLSLGTAPDVADVECQLSTAELIDEPTTETVTTFCGEEEFATPAYKLHLAGFQDWGAVESVMDILHAAYVADPVAEIDFVLTVGSKTRTGKAKPTQDVPFGGEAGSALKFDVTLSVVGVPTEGTVTP